VGKIVNYSGCVGAIFSVIIAIMIVAICIRIKCRGKKAIIETKGLKSGGGGLLNLELNGVARKQIYS
jgi:hypothetical protein